MIRIIWKLKILISSMIGEKKKVKADFFSIGLWNQTLGVLVYLHFVCGQMFFIPSQFNSLNLLYQFLVYSAGTSPCFLFGYPLLLPTSKDGRISQPSSGSHISLVLHAAMRRKAWLIHNCISCNFFCPVLSKSLSGVRLHHISFSLHAQLSPQKGKETWEECLFETIIK